MKHHMFKYNLKTVTVAEGLTYDCFFILQVKIKRQEKIG